MTARDLRPVPAPVQATATTTRTEQITQCRECWQLCYAYQTGHGLVVAPHGRPSQGLDLCPGAHQAVRS